jgi:hypothetical protein
MIQTVDQTVKKHGPMNSLNRRLKICGRFKNYKTKLQNRKYVRFPLDKHLFLLYDSNKQMFFFDSSEDESKKNKRRRGGFL